MSDRLTIGRPDDFHLHLRDGGMLTAVAAQSAHFARAIIMPNLIPPVTNAEAVVAYRARIDAAAPADFTPLMTLYLTDETTPDTIDTVKDHIVAAKLYPAHATTNSAAGVTNPLTLVPVLERMAEHGLLLLVHGEVTDPAVDIFDREAVFLERVLTPLREAVPQLRVVLEHISSRTGVDYVLSGPDNLGGTITAHHLVIDRNDLLVGGIRPHRYCLPIVKRTDDREALVAAATSDCARLFFGSDSAPHSDPKKLGPCGAAGCFTAPVALAMMAEVFDDAGALEKLDAFVATRGADFYGLPRNPGHVLLERADNAPLPPDVETDEGPVAIFDSGRPLRWQVVEVSDGA